ncbi:AMP-dependent synthetase/ligase [Xylona heveae TC161]|uniref:AMP-dependent synthetase/ligase n=1 Tax=Xylona heveae (strain CBS 132557 / TC161) TaxID=1328760 RepID=A0A165FGZ3_XYLHT|nr:AMP-dependent synthetase/ligase [Xylona heveae TC161]KZF20968.1 AMP-dependent synthetase/ligase [Xylona heveae TC161]
MADPLHLVLQELVKFVRANSPYYRELYKTLEPNVSDLQKLPVIQSEQFWEANTVNNNRLLTGPIIDGGIYASGGTTATPKISYYTRDELRRLVQALTIGLVRSGIMPGDRIANLYNAGDLYMGFLLQILSLQEFSIPNVNLPITGNIAAQAIVNHLKILKATVIFTNTTTLLRVADHILQAGSPNENIRLILFAGESMYRDLQPLLKRAFPQAKVGPLMFCSVDAGMIALPIKPLTEDAIDTDATYVVNSPSIILELLDDNDKPIVQSGHPGRVVITDLTRRLQPVIRYPMGDVGEWVDFNAQTFAVRGRDAVAVKVSTVILELPLLRKVLAETLGDTVLTLFQTVIRRRENRNQVIFRIANGKEPPNPELVEKEIHAKLAKLRPQYEYNVAQHNIFPISCEWVGIKELQFNVRTGKLKDIIDERY